MKYIFIRLRIKNIGPHTPDQISLQIQTCVVKYGEDHQLRIHNEINQSNLNRQSKYSYCRNEGHHRENYPYRQ